MVSQAALIMTASPRNDIKFSPRPNDKSTKILGLLDERVKSEYDAATEGAKNDHINRDVMTIMENFERVFVSYINDNYRSFTEKDLKRLIDHELR